MRSKKIVAAVFIPAFIIAFIAGILYAKNADKKAPSINGLPVSVTLPILSEANAPAFSGTSAVSSCLIDAKSGAVLYGKNENARMPMASTTKIMTALVALERLSPDAVVKIPKEAAGIEGSSIYLFENEEITVENLLYGLMLESGNDAAAALAIAAAGSTEKFAELMNTKAHEMGLIDTHFTNPHGLNDENHYTTAYELALIAANALENEDFRRITSTQSMHVKVNDREVTRYFVNHNKLLKLYDGCIGVKTGFTKAAGRCLVSAAEKDGRTYVAVTLNDGDDWRDHTNLLDYAFDNFSSVEIAAENEFTVYCGGKAYSNPDGVYLTVGKGESPEISYSAEIAGNYGNVSYFLNGVKAGSFGLSEKTYRGFAVCGRRGFSRDSAP